MKEDNWRMVRSNKRDSNEEENGRNAHEVMESNAEEHDEHEEDDDRN